MNTLSYNSIAGKAPEIIEDVMALPVVAEQAALEFTLRLVLEELVVNVVNYAYGEGGDGPLDITVENRDDAIVITLTDQGVPFNPLEQEAPDTDLPPEERPIGGLGIFLVREMMDNVTYRYEAGHNILTVGKGLKV